MKKIMLVIVLVICMSACKKESNSTFCYKCELEQGLRIGDSTLTSNTTIFNVFTTQNDIDNNYSFYHVYPINGTNGYNFEYQGCIKKN
jgi:hypothetical protein